MRSSHVIRLDDYRTRREQRRREVFALYGADGERSRLVLQLWRAVALLGADRAATVWIDQYGPGLVHVFCLLDLASDPPRRTFTPELLRAAWENGVPGVCDIPDAARAPGIPLPQGVRSACAVALGSDGARSWFLVVDSLTTRTRLDDALRADLMFSAGECAGLVLHRDLGEPQRDGAETAGESIEQKRRRVFAGWPVLLDIEGRDEDEEANQRIARRFLVVRAVRMLVDEDFAVEPESIEYQVRGVRSELADAPADDPERIAWEAVLAAAERLDPGALVRALLDLGQQVERLGHLHGAREIYRNAYDVATAAPDLTAALDAAHFHARACRKLADWPEAETWYRRAFEMASGLDDCAHAARILDGLASVYRFRGNMPRCRQTLEQALDLARASGDPDALASIHHHFMVLERHFEHLDQATVHGWKAVQLYRHEQDRLLALFDLAGVLLDRRALRAARDAYAIVALRINERGYRLMALGGAALASAELAEEDEFERWSRVLDREGWRDAETLVRTQILYNQGLALAKLARTAQARALLAEAETLARDYKLGKLLFEAEAALQALEQSTHAAAVPNARHAPVDPTLTHIAEELRTLRDATAPAATL